MSQNHPFSICESAPPVPTRRPATTIDRRPSWATQADIDPSADLIRQKLAERQKIRDELRHDDKLQDLEEEHRSTWMLLSRILTVFVPDFVLNPFLAHRDEKQKWRGKMALSILLFLLCGGVTLTFYYTGFVACKPPMQVSYDHPSLQYAILVNGKVYKGTSNKSDFDLIGNVANSEYPADLSFCPRSLPKTAYCGGRFNRECRNVNSLRDFYGGTVSFPWESITVDSGLVVYGNSVLDLNPYFGRDKGFLGPEVGSFLMAHLGLDISHSVHTDEHLSKCITCLASLYRVGVVDMVSLPCSLSYILLGVLLLVCSIFTIAKFSLVFYQSTIRSVDASNRKDPSFEKDILIFIPCQAENISTIKTCLDSVAATNYPDSKKMAFIAVDGDSECDNLTMHLSKWFDVTDRQRDLSEACFYASIRAQSRRASVFRGVYRHDGHTLPSIIVVKHGTSKLDAVSCRADSLYILLNLLSSLHTKDMISGLEYAIYRAYKMLSGRCIDGCEYLLTLDVDTEVAPDSLRVFTDLMNLNPKAMAACGRAEIICYSSWISPFQVYHNFSTDRYHRDYESVLGRVTCLPTSFSIFRLFGENSTLIHPAIIGSLQDSPHCDMTKLLFYQFPNMRTMYTPLAVYHSIFPTGPFEFFKQHCQQVRSRLACLISVVKPRTILDSPLEILHGNLPSKASSSGAIYPRSLLSRILAGLELMGICTLSTLLPLMLLTAGQFLAGDAWLPTGSMLFSILAIIIWGPILLPWLVAPAQGSLIAMLFYILLVPFWSFLVPFYSIWHTLPRLNELQRDTDLSLVDMRTVEEHEAFSPPNCEFD